jgi:excisionase family DNA binding protein
MAEQFGDTFLVSPVGRVYTTAQVATLLQVHRHTVQRLIAQGALHALQVGRRWRVTDQQLQAFLAQQARQAPADPGGTHSPHR